jgi:hypothetical protein
LIRSDRADPGADAAASPPAVELELKAKEMTNALSDGISALVDSCWSRLGGARDCRHCIVKSNAEPPEDDNLEQEVAQPEERAQPRSRLSQGPPEFREDRVERPKAKGR